jgi:hypothetical protein
MKKTGTIRKQLFNLATAVSLAFFVLSIALWVWSYREADIFVGIGPSARGKESAQCVVALSEGDFAFIIGDTTISPGEVDYWYPTSALSDPSTYFVRLPQSATQRLIPQTGNQRLIIRDFIVTLPLALSEKAENVTSLGGQFLGTECHYWRWYPHSWQGAESAMFLLLPFWLMTLTTSVIPFVWGIRRFCRRHPAGSCQSCGYDLRATPDRCPECGAVDKSEIHV